MCTVYSSAVIGCNRLIPDMNYMCVSHPYIHVCVYVFITGCCELSVGSDLPDVCLTYMYILYTHVLKKYT